MTWRLASAGDRTEDGTIATGFTSGERERFHNLLKLAAESPFAGERENALAAARRMAESHGLDLEDAARGGEAPQPIRVPDRPPFAWWPRRTPRPAATVEDIAADKARREEALREAQARGLDAEERRAAQQAQRAYRRRPNPSRMDHMVHARVLLTETSLPLQEVADLTGLDIYQVTGLKLKLRDASWAGVSPTSGAFNQV